MCKNAVHVCLFYSEACDHWKLVYYTELYSLKLIAISQHYGSASLKPVAFYNTDVLVLAVQSTLDLLVS